MGQTDTPFHRGETEIQARLGIVREMAEKGRRVIRDRIPEDRLGFFAQLSFLAIGSADECGRPWASVVAGKPGFVRAIDPGVLELRARPVYGDRLKKALIEGADIAVLGLDLETRGRFRVNGKIGQVRDGGFDVHVRQAFPNCPQYIQTRASEPGAEPETIATRKTVQRGATLAGPRPP